MGQYYGIVLFRKENGNDASFFAIAIMHKFSCANIQIEEKIVDCAYYNQYLPLASARMMPSRRLIYVCCSLQRPRP